MTFKQLQDAFELHVGIEGEIDGAQLAIWFNEAQLDLAMDCGKVTSISYRADTEHAYSLPEDCLKIVEVDGAQYHLTPDQKVVFDSADNANVTLYYRKMPQLFVDNNPDQISELHPALHDLIPLFAASRYWDRESEGDYEETAHGSKWMNYYLQGKEVRKRSLDGIIPKLDCWQVI